MCHGAQAMGIEKSPHTKPKQKTISESMVSSTLAQLYQSSFLSGSNASFIEALYESWLEDPASVPDHWRSSFEQLAAGSQEERGHLDIQEKFRLLSLIPPTASGCDTQATDHKQAGVLKLVNAYRVRGHENANLDPLNLRPAEPLADLQLASHDLDSSDLETEFDTGSLAAPDRMKLKDIIALCEQVYCHSIGVEYMHIVDTNKRRWLQARLEGSEGQYNLSEDVKKRILEKITAAEGIEKYLHTKYVGQKRFSLEGGESLISLLHETVMHAGGQDIEEVVIGMAHRGRLNVLVNILGKAPEDLFAEFEGRHANDNPSRSGDVKYHLGYSSDIKTPGGLVHMALAFNPSHLEIVNPVVAGSAKARQIRRHDDQYDEVMPILIHGDAAFAGQGVGMELIQMSETRGFAVGGTLHIVVNNQVGFTTSNPADSRSTAYCTAVAKLVNAPIFHVNADDPEAVQHVMKIACDFRKEFKRDVVIDLVCYRRHGHNEADEPAATQPMMYKTIRALKTTRQKYAEQLVAEGLYTRDETVAIMDDYRDRLDHGKCVANVEPDIKGSILSVDWSPYIGHEWTEQVNTGMSHEDIQRLSTELTTLPEDFKLHSRVQRIIDDRKKMTAGELPLDWGYAETMAYAGLIEENYHLRMVGQDSGRGTFFHRHAVLHNQNDGNTRLPLATLNDEADVTVIDSLLSEEAVLGFEYGYATADPNTLVIWEGQFGDFANGAQVVIDQFISSGEAKWGRLCGLVMFLPHGYEGQGPEHSSARLERYMQLCSNFNIQVCVPSTPAQMFHMLRRQMLRPYRKPLIVMTPKSLLRNKASTSSLDDLVNGHFHTVIHDDSVDAAKVKRVVLCSGKVYYDLLEARDAGEHQDVALVRVEQLYPFPRDEVISSLQQYAQAEEIVWCQEEPQNQGAWYQIRHHFQACTTESQILRYAGRPSSPSPAVGYYSVHLEEQNALVEQALTLGQGEIQ